MLVGSAASIQCPTGVQPSNRSTSKRIFTAAHGGCQPPELVWAAICRVVRKLRRICPGSNATDRGFPDVFLLGMIGGMKKLVFYIFAVPATLLLFAGLAFYPQDGSPSQVLILASAILGAIAFTLLPRFDGETKRKWPSRLRSGAVRLGVGIGLGLFSGGVIVVSQIVAGAIHPLDRWHAFYVYESIGGIAGITVGLYWGIMAVRNFESPVRRENSDSPPDVP